MAEPNQKRPKMDNLAEKSISGSSSNSPEDREVMDEPNPKRAEIDDLTEKSDSSKDPKVELEEVIINPSIQDFKYIRNMIGFIDHTLFIYAFLKRNIKLAIFAPRRFGKSSQLDMIKTFLKIHVDEKTGKFSLNGLAETRKNYQIFKGTNILKCKDCKEIVEAHLGKHPVIHLDFKRAKIESIEEAESFYRSVVHVAYLEHAYLRFSENLDGNKEANATAQRICSKWCDEEQCDMQKLKRCLQFLARCLYNHFNGAKVYILIDEFDAVNASALFRVCGKDRLKTLTTICDILADMLAPVVKGGDEHVAGVLITGVSYMSGLGYSSVLNNLHGIKFLEVSGSFSPSLFCGASSDDIKSLIEKLVKDNKLVKFKQKDKLKDDDGKLNANKIFADVKSRYNGYFDEEGNPIFCMWSVLQYLQTGKAKYYWNVTDGIKSLSGILKSEKVAYQILKLIRGDVIKFERVAKLQLEDMLKLIDLMLENNASEANLDIVFSFLMDQGYVSYPESRIAGDNSIVENFKVPNLEIRAALYGMIRDIVGKFWEISTESCTNLIEEITPSLMKDEEQLQKQVLAIYKNISEILNPLKQKDPTHVNEAKMVCVMYKALADAKSFTLGVDSQIKDKEGKCITLDRPDFLMLHKNDEKLAILWELKFNRDKKDKYTTSLHALLEAKGKLSTQNNKLKKYTVTLTKLGREALIIGLSMTIDSKVSLSYSLSTRDKIYSITNEEDKSYPELYENHKPIVLLP